MTTTPWTRSTRSWTWPTTSVPVLLARDEEEVQAGRRSPDTVAFHRSKAGHLVRLFETADGGAPRR